MSNAHGKRVTHNDVRGANHNRRDLTWCRSATAAVMLARSRRTRPCGFRSAHVLLHGVPLPRLLLPLLVVDAYVAILACQHLIFCPNPSSYTFRHCDRERLCAGASQVTRLWSQRAAAARRLDALARNSRGTRGCFGNPQVHWTALRTSRGTQPLLRSAGFVAASGRVAKTYCLPGKLSPASAAASVPQ